MEIDTPHLRMPFGVTNGKVDAVEQDTFEDVVGCVEVILCTPRGFREELPKFGTADPAFTSPPDITRLRNAVAEWETRAEVTTDESYSAFDVGLRNVLMNVKIGER